MRQEDELFLESLTRIEAKQKSATRTAIIGIVLTAVLISGILIWRMLK